MKDEKTTVKIALLIVISLSFNTAILVSAQSTVPSANDYGGSYKAKIGDTVTYKFTKVLNNGINYVKSGLQLENDTIVPFNITQGMKFSVKVNDTTTTNPRCQILVTLPDQLLTSKNQICYYLMMGFNNTSDAQTYVQALQNSGSNVSIDGDYITNNYVSPLTNSTSVTNWKTGWLQSQESIFKANNGTILSDMKIEMENTSNGFGIDTNTIMTVLALTLVPVFFCGGAVLALRMKKK